MTPDAKTALYAVLGTPIAHSLSPALHTAAFRAEGRNAVYVACDVGEAGLAEALRGLFVLGARGANLTAPLKTRALALVDEVSPQARRAGAVNTLKFERGLVVGHNTDGEGFVRFLHRAGVPIEGAHVAFLGGGGAVRGLAVALRTAKVSTMTAVVRWRATRLPIEGVEFAQDPATAEAAVRAATIVVQATPLGARAADALPAPPEWVGANAVAIDLRYDPAVTPWLTAVRARGVRSANGLGMLIEQALLSQELWHHSTPPRSALEEAVAWSEPFSPGPPGS